ncbi:hypothetical protein HDK64DRAFT_135205 [Phyllosticta capitalensis]
MSWARREEGEKGGGTVRRGHDGRRATWSRADWQKAPDDAYLHYPLSILTGDCKAHHVAGVAQQRFCHFRGGGRHCWADNSVDEGAEKEKGNDDDVDGDAAKFRSVSTQHQQRTHRATWPLGVLVPKNLEASKKKNKTKKSVEPGSGFARERVRGRDERKWACRTAAAPARSRRCEQNIQPAPTPTSLLRAPAHELSLLLLCA